jgi:hypothetical protein
VPVKALFISQCEADQCNSGGGGAICAIEGNRGEAVWHYGAVAHLVIERFDDKVIVVHRTDPVGTYSTKYANGKEFTASYTGTIVRTGIYGKVLWNENNPGTWYAEIADSVCAVNHGCMLDQHQLVELGENSLGAKLYSAAFLCFKRAAEQGDYDGQSYEGLMLSEGAPGINADPAEGLRLLTDAAQHKNMKGELGLAHLYEFGIGIRKDPALAAGWKDEAADQAQAVRAQEARARANQATGMAIGATVLGLLFLGAMDSDGSGGDDDQRARDIKACNEYGEAGACTRLGRMSKVPN